jgi:ubiquinone/menaquinone biosynthesis C-methylase UbiE
VTYINILKSKLSNYIKKPLEAANAYDLWASKYDEENDNLVFDLEGEILDSILGKAELKNKIILDYGCGTGRNRETLLSFKPKNIIGCDVSKEMLGKLKVKFPDEEVFLIDNPGKPELPIAGNSFDIIFSTLVIAHSKNIKKVFELWERLLKKNGEIILTDLHPEVLSKGGKRTFNLENKTYEVKNYIHSIYEIKNICSEFNLKISELLEKHIDENVKSFYERNNALHIYEKFKGLPLVYGMLIRK